MLPQIDSRKTHVFTLAYQQPEEYRFCQDSVLLAEFVAEQLATLKLPSSFKALDLCAGCGVVGLELSYLRPEIRHFDFIEVQPLFKNYFDANLSLLGNRECFRFFSANYESLKDESWRAENEAGPYDLIVANPPYFFENEGSGARKSVRNRCRFFIDSSFEALLDSIVSSLKPKGQAFVLVKSGEKHGRNLDRIVGLHLMGRATAQRVARIRGTDVLKITIKA